MPLIYRDGRPRLQRSRRVGSRVVTQYVASGDSAVILARLEAIERDAAREMRIIQAAELREADELLADLDGILKPALAAGRAELAAAGFHQVARSRWRKRRERRP